MAGQLNDVGRCNVGVEQRLDCRLASAVVGLPAGWEIALLCHGLGNRTDDVLAHRLG